jgi:anthranilate phosphoribosyltransferase
MPITFPEVFSELQAGALGAKTTEASFDAMLEGAFSPIQVGAFLAALRIRGESAETIAAAARSMRRVMIPVDAEAEVVLDTCGTGGDGSGSVNLSTAAAIICAAAGVTVAKHGNRAVSSRAGSADVLSALGVPIELPVSASAELLKRVGIAFLLAPTHHPAMRHVMPVRRDLGVRTLFNCLGPLANPAGATHQLIGAFSDELRPALARTLKELGTRRAWVVHGADGMDEVSPYGPTHVTQLANGELDELVVSPSDFGLEPSPKGAAAGGDAAANAEILEAVFRNRPHPARDAIVLNAAAALVVASAVEPRRAREQVEALLADGAAWRKLEAWRAEAKALL